ncbi:DUF4190 domain-containing protein [Luteipulveratus halotolerans]|uniref:DUF4190 domain-containing protein n=1 Tax=Luteipulveratus halotolerans TaxID=1631356 RepID=UPI000AC05010|nr:DUF4190 domain-containing protein [Luteipulveratus halotolerans]
MNSQTYQQDSSVLTDPYAAPGSPSYAAPQAPATDVFAAPPLRTGRNGLAIAGFVVSFFGGALGLVLSVVGLLESRKYVGRAGRGLAIAGICISVVTTVLSLLLLAVVVVGVHEGIAASQMDDDVVPTSTLQVGQCFNHDHMESTSTASGVPTMPTVTIESCALPHELEAFHRANLTYADYPGDAAVISEAETRCTDAFEPFVGVSPDQSSLVVTYYGPTEDAWAAGERDVLCMVGEASGPTIETTLRGAAR